MSTTRRRAKYPIFRRDNRGQLAIDDSAGYRTVLVGATAEIREDLTAELPRFRALRVKYGREVPGDGQLLDALNEEGRILLAFSPDQPMESWTSWGLD